MALTEKERLALVGALADWRVVCGFRWPAKYLGLYGDIQYASHLRFIRRREDKAS